MERAGKLSLLPPGALSHVYVGDRQIALCNVDGEVFAIDGVCPHKGGPLGEGALHGHMVVCPYHAWEFDCRTGEHDYNPSLIATPYRVKIEDGEIFVELP